MGFSKYDRSTGGYRASGPASVRSGTIDAATAAPTPARNSRRENHDDMLSSPFRRCLSGHAHLLREANAPSMIDGVIPDGYGYPRGPARPLVGLRPTVVADAVDKRAAGEMVCATGLAFRNLDGMAGATVRHLGTIAGARNHAMLDHRLCQRGRSCGGRFVIKNAIGLRQDSAAGGAQHAYLRPVETIGRNRAEKQ